MKDALLGGPALYTGKVSISAGGSEISFDLKSTLGFKIGAELQHKLQNNLSLNASGFYRSLEMELENELLGGNKADFSGFEFSGGLSYKF